MSSTPGIAILGAGLFAKGAYLPAFAAIGAEGLPLKAIYSRSEKSAVAFKQAVKETLNLSDEPSLYHDEGDASLTVDALLERSDILGVIVVMPITLQPSIIVKALAAGKHVLSEKPVAPDVKSGQDLIRTYTEVYKPKGLIWRVAENYEAEPGYRRAAQIIRDGKIGDVIFFRAVVVNYINTETKWYKTPWRTVPDYQGGFLLDGGVHTIAALRTVLPHPITHLSGFASLNKEILKPHDTIHAILKSEGHFHGTLELSWGLPHGTKPEADTFVFTGTKGWLSIRAGDKAMKLVIKSSDDPTGEQVQEETFEEARRGVELEVKSFFDAISGTDDGLGLGDPSAALFDVAVIQAGLNSDGNLTDVRGLVAA